MVIYLIGCALALIMVLWIGDWSLKKSFYDFEGFNMVPVVAVAGSWVTVTVMGILLLITWYGNRN